MGWLSLTVGSALERSLRHENRVLISVPKKIVPLATQRNRIKRLIREAVRQDAFCKREKLFTFKVLSPAEGMKLEAVKKMIESLKRT